MDINKVYAMVKELGHVNSKRDELREYCKLKLDHIINFLPRRILGSDGADLLDCILTGLADNPDLKTKIIDIVLQQMRKEVTSLTHCGDIISRICLELHRMPAADLVRWCGDSVQSIVEDADVNMIWRDVLPECVSALSSHNTIKHCGTELSPAEYKEQCVHTLCQCRWKEKQLVQLSAMFKDLQLMKNDHRQVLNKMCSYMIDIPPETLPPLIHQLLKLCKTNDIEIVLAHLSHYFSIKLYSKLEPPPDSETTTMDIDDIEQYSSAELSRCLSTCLYHISQGAAEPELIRKHIRTWPKTQLLRAPFLIDLALAISDKGADFRSVCLDVVKAAIEQRVTDELTGKQAAWARAVLPIDADVAAVFKVLTTESANHRQLTVVGAINLGFSLLGVSRIKPCSSPCWSYGKLVLVRLCKSQPETAPHILSQLADKLAADCTQRQYAECLYVLCSLSPVSLERCTQLSAILENCQPTPTDYKAAAAVLDAVHPLINFSTRTRDTLVMVCRKGLYSRDCTHRCLALSGFLTVLRHVKVSSSLSLSQEACSESSAHSYLTQVTVELHATGQGTPVTSRVRNEAVCMEVVSILRRCLVQDAGVKQLLYNKIYECAIEKAMLHEAIVELLYEHLNKYLPDDDNASPLLIDKCVQITATSAILTEPIGHLLYTIAQFLQPAENEDLEDILSSQYVETGSTHLKNKLNSIMEKICASDQFGKIDIDDVLTDLTPESKANNLKVQQTLQCYEALVAHEIMQWNVSSDHVADLVYKLYAASHQILEKTKSPPKLGKKGSKSTLNETRDTVKTQKSQKDKGKAPVKLPNLVKDRTGPFKPLPCVWDLKLCLRVVELLYSETVPWSSMEQRNQIRSKRDVHQWAMRCVLSVLNERAEKKTLHTVAAIAGVLYKRCIGRFESMCEFDDHTTLSCIDVFRECVTLLFSTQFSVKPHTFLPTITGLSDATPPAHIAAILKQLLSSLLRVEEDSGENTDATLKRVVVSLVQTASVLLEKGTACSAESVSVLSKLEGYVRTSKQDCLPLIPALLTAGLREHKEALFLDELLTKLAVTLGTIDEEESSAESGESTIFPTIDSRTGHTVLNQICTHLNFRYKCAEHMLQRARDLTNALTVAVHAHQLRIDKELKQLYRSLVMECMSLTACVTRAAGLRCCVGGGSDRVLTAAIRLYNMLSTLARQVDPEVAQIVRLDRLLKLSGKKLSSVMDSLIMYLEASQQQQTANKVLRETKLIPRLVLAAEMFYKNVIMLANKAKVNYQQYLPLGTARDFRIKAPMLQEALAAMHREDRGDGEATVNINDAETEILSSSENEEEEGGSDEESSSKKRTRIS